MPKKKVKNEQNVKTTKNQASNKKVIFQIVGFSFSIILLIFALYFILNFNTEEKSNRRSVLKKFDEYYQDETFKVFFYYDSDNTEDSKSSLEISYLLQINKDYDIDYLVLDKALFNDDDENNIEKKLGIKDEKDTISIVKDSNVIATQSGFVESQELVQLLVEAHALPEDSKYKPTDNIKFINYDKYRQLLDSDEEKVVVIGEAGCQYCASAKVVLNNISKGYKFDINYLDLMDLNDEDYREFFMEIPEIGYNEESLQTDHVFQTPTIFIVKNGKIVSYVGGIKSLEEYISYFSENKIIK